VRLTVKPADDGQRLDVFLAEPLGSRARAARLIEAGAVTVAGQAVAKRHKVSAGDEVVVDEPAEPQAPPQVDAPTNVVVRFEDDYLLVVDKPAGLVVHPAPGHPTGTMSQLLSGKAAGGDDAWRAGIVHRLDKNTSGLLVVAKSEVVHRQLKNALQRREIHREYLALVDGRPESRSGTIDAPIGRDRRARTKISTETDAPREARTHFEIVEALSASTLLRVTLETGRTHQIRAHLKAIGLPVCGDPDYGRKGVYGLERQFLHAARLSFDHPLSGEELDVESPLPPDLEAALIAARTSVVDRG
jgi:23S rRNA pseudouridine1911/1915/1917 synthase